MIRHLTFLLLPIIFASCIQAKKDECCLSDKLINPITKSDSSMTDFLQKFDVTVTSNPEVRSFQRNGCGKLVRVSFANPAAANNTNSHIEIFIDSSKRYIYPVGIGNKSKGYVSPSLIYKGGTEYQLPLGNGLDFLKSCQVSFVISPITTNPLPPGNGKGKFDNILLIWGKQ